MARARRPRTRKGKHKRAAKREARKARPPGIIRVPKEERARRRRVREALLKEGFVWEAWQKPERDMIFGMIKREGDMQVHVRYYRGGIVKAEYEISHRFMEHLISPRSSHHTHVAEMLARHGVTDVQVVEKDFPQRMKGKMPSTRTPWRPVVLGAGAMIAGAILGSSRWWRRRKT